MKKTKMFNQIWIRDPCNHQGILSRVPLVICSCSSQCCYDSLWEMLQQHCLHNAQLMHLRSLWQPYGITWLWRTIRANQWDNAEGWKKKIQIKSQIMLLVTFIHALPKMSVCVFCVCLFSLFTMVLLFMQACDDCCQCIGWTGWEEHECLFLFYSID